MPSKYQPLAAYLADQPGPTAMLTFAQIEALLGFPLPPTAYTQHSWWSGAVGGHAQVRAWQAAGWRVEQVRVRARTVTFARTAGS